MNLDAVTAQQATDEIKKNADRATAKHLVPFNPINIVTPEISGLRNRSAMQAAFDFGIRFLVSDTSRNPATGDPVTTDVRTPNTGEYNQFHTPTPNEQPIFMIPRRPTSLFVNVSQPDEWESEYRCIHGAYWDA